VMSPPTSSRRLAANVRVSDGPVSPGGGKGA
jgi:hypothetical protein